VLQTEVRKEGNIIVAVMHHFVKSCCYIAPYSSRTLTVAQFDERNLERVIAFVLVVWFLLFIWSPETCTDGLLLWIALKSLKKVT